jgi:PncC family amidohydrolase
VATKSLEKEILTVFTSKSLRLSTAESCTGGLISHRLSNVPGSSAYLLGGVVAYSNSAKVSLLGVRPDDLDRHGAVSEPVARAMAEGANAAFGSTVGVGVTGIAGPDGGTPEKPVGLVYVSVASPSGTIVAKCHFSGSRESIKEQTTEKAMMMVLESVK